MHRAQPGRKQSWRSDDDDPIVDEDSQISDTVNGSKVDVGHPHSGIAAVVQTTAGAQPYQLRLRRVETESVRTHPSLDALDAHGRPRS